MAGPAQPTSNDQRIYEVVRAIPRGKVATYGQVARLAGIPNGARQVGYALHSLPEGSPVPWHRVLNARGEVSLRSEGASDRIQRVLLEREGVAFNAKNRVDFETALWIPAARKAGARPRRQAAKRKAR